MEDLNRLQATLDSPIKRAGFAVLILGSVLTLIGLFQIGAELRSYRWFENFMIAIGCALSFDRYTYRNFPLACIGPYVLIGGLFCSFLYDKTIGRFLSWILRG